MCLVGASTTLVKAKVEASLPRKRGAAAAGYDKAITSFYDKARTRPRQASMLAYALCRLLSTWRLCMQQSLGHVAGAARW